MPRFFLGINTKNGFRTSKMAGSILPQRLEEGRGHLEGAHKGGVSSRFEVANEDIGQSKVFYTPLS